MPQSNANKQQQKQTLRLLQCDLPNTPQEEFFEDHKHHKITDAGEYHICRTCAERMYKQ